ncbi:MAG: hypothetical protein H8K04_17470 [Nitrospira sp.]
MRMLVIITSAALFVACGVVGSPVPPEYVGVAVTIDKQKKQHALEAERDAVDPAVGDPSLENPDINLPPSYPVGTR